MFLELGWKRGSDESPGLCCPVPAVSDRDAIRSTRKAREPVRKPWIWAVLVFVMLAAIPRYLPKGTMGFVLLGIPYWMFISVAFTLLMSAYISWLCFTQWDVVEAEEESGRSSRVGNIGSESGEE